MPYIMLIRSALAGTRPSHAPQGVANIDQDYSPFLHETREAAETEIQKDDASFDHDSGGWVEPCTVHADGSIHAHDSNITLSRSAIYAAFDMSLSPAPSPRT